MEIKRHPAYLYAQSVVKNKVIAPKYVVMQCKDFIKTCDGKNKKYEIDVKKLHVIDNLLKIIRMPKGLRTGEPLKECLAGFQWLLIIASLCVVYRNDNKHRRYESVLLEIARKNGKTFIIGLIFLLLLLMEPKFSKMYSVAPDGALSREVKEALNELINYNSDIFPQEGRDAKFKIRLNDVEYLEKKSKFIPLNYSNSRLDGKLPSAFLADEVGALPNSYAVEAMRSGQLTILNKIGFIISTKYPTTHNPFEDEVEYAKKVLSGYVKDETVFALLYEPDDTTEWTSDDNIIAQANPLALEVDEIWDDLLKKRQRAIEVESARENFLTKHCNIVYQGMGTESYVDVTKVKACRVDSIDWEGRDVWIGVDLAQTNDNCSVSMVAVDDNDNILADSMAFIPEGRIDEKNQFEHIDYRRYIKAGKCIACGDMVVDYGVIEDYVSNIEEKYKCHIVSIGYDRYNALSSAQKWSKEFTTIEIRQHSDTLHPPTKLLAEKIESGEFRYPTNELLEINFENAKCTYDTNLNRYVNKKKSNGKVDMVVSMIDAVYLLQQDVIFNDSDFVIQVI